MFFNTHLEFWILHSNLGPKHQSVANVFERCANKHELWDSGKTEFWIMYSTFGPTNKVVDHELEFWITKSNFGRCI